MTDDREPVTLFICGPAKDCDAHKWSGDDMIPVGDGGYSAYCLLCGALAIDEAMWGP